MFVTTFRIDLIDILWISQPLLYMLMNFFAFSHHGTSQDTLMSIETIYILHDLSVSSCFALKYCYS